MQVIDYHEAIFASELTSNAKLTALAISKYYNWKEDKVCWPSNKTLAKATSLSVRSIVRAKNELVNAGYLVSHRRFNDSNVYKTTTPSQKVSYPGTGLPTNKELNNEVNNEIKKVSNETLDSSINKSKVIFLDTNTSGTSFGSFKQTEGPAAASDLLDWFG
jgi:DNA-binding transcriptional MocR family regulator